MGSTSIHLKPCKVGSLERYNVRLKELDHIRPELSFLNESWQSDDKTIEQHFEELRRAYKEAKGKKMHAKATPIREGVIVIKEDTSIEDLKRFAKACEERWGIKALQIHTCKDDGHLRDGVWKPTPYAHIVFLWADEKGVTRKLTKFDMAQMQTLLAETLGMDRGVSSDKKHLDAIQYKLEKSRQDLEEVQAHTLELKNALEAPQKPLEELLREHTYHRPILGDTIDYKSIVEILEKQEQAKEVLRSAQKSAEKAEIQRLRAELAKAEKRAKIAEERASKAEQRLSQISELIG